MSEFTSTYGSCFKDEVVRANYLVGTMDAKVVFKFEVYTLVDSVPKWYVVPLKSRHIYIHFQLAFERRLLFCLRLPINHIFGEFLSWKGDRPLFHIRPVDVLRDDLTGETKLILKPTKRLVTTRLIELQTKKYSPFSC